MLDIPTYVIHIVNPLFVRVLPCIISESVQILLELNPKGILYVDTNLYLYPRNKIFTQNKTMLFQK